MTGSMKPKDIQRFFSKVNVVDNCWEWTDSLQRGYGYFKLKGKYCLSHRLSYKLFNGDLDDNLTIDHLCRNRKCVNPEHLEQVTIQENVVRGFGPTAINSKKTHCIRDHEFTIDNTFIRKSGGRTCRICKRFKEKMWVRTHPKKEYVNN